NADPNKVDYPIPANDDATKSIRTITNFMVEAIREGLAEREKHKAEKEAETGAPAE
ncbi:MAG TPA: 30S ribosomal protein S2, partial [Phaeodactylibacter sp.]|nr:30S ribosomal protein S2 [Phaeodactylibacter sp.]